MNKTLILALIAFGLSACGGLQGKKIKDVNKMTLGEIEKVTKELTPEQVQVLGDAVGRCQVNSEAEICKKTIKEVIKN